MGNLERRAVRWYRKPASSDPGLGGPGRTGTALPDVQAAVAKAERRRLSWWQGENERVGATSLEILTRYGWTGLHGVRWAGAADESISHVAVGPGGVVVVDEKDWTGNVTVQNGILRHGGYRCEGDIERLTAACATVTALLAPEHRTSVVGVLCVTTRDMPPEPTAGVYVVGRLHLASLLVDLAPRLSPLEVADIARELASRLLGVTPPPRARAQAPRVETHTSALASEPSGYFVPRPIPGSPHDPATAGVPLPNAQVPPPAHPIPVPVPATQVGPVVRVRAPWPGGELVTPPSPAAAPAPVAPCWPGDEGPAAARPMPARANTPGWPSAAAPQENWTGVPAAAEPVAAPVAQPTTPGWPGRPSAPLVAPEPIEVPPATAPGWSTTAQATTPGRPGRPALPAGLATPTPDPASARLRGIDAIRLGVAVVAGLVVFSNTAEIATAVTDWLEPETVTTSSAPAAVD
jgi:hypothetical protein